MYGSFISSIYIYVQIFVNIEIYDLESPSLNKKHVTMNSLYTVI